MVFFNFHQYLGTPSFVNRQKLREPEFFRCQYLIIASANSSFYKATHIFIDNLRAFTYVHKFDDFKQALISSAAIDRMELLAAFSENHGPVKP